MNFVLLLLAMAVSYAAAYNRSRPPSLLLASLLLALAVLSVALPMVMLRGLALQRRARRFAQVGDQLELDIAVHNGSWLPRLMVEVEDRWMHSPKKGDWTAGGTTAAAEDHRRLSLGMVPWLGAKARHSFTARLDCTRRGLWSLGPARLVSSFPLGMLQTSRLEDQPAQEVLVYPRMFHVAQLSLAGSSLEVNRDEQPLRIPQGQDEFVGVREYRHGDPLKHIHWAATAHHGELLVREFEPTSAARLCLALDLHALSDVGADEWTTGEAAISMAASISAWAARTGTPLRVLAAPQEGPAPAVQDGQLGGEHDTDPLLSWFAALSTRWSYPYAKVLNEVESTTHQGETVVCFVSPDESHRAQTTASLVSLQDAGAQVLAIVMDRDSFLNPGAGAVSPPAQQLRAELEAHGMQAFVVQHGTNLKEVFS